MMLPASTKETDYDGRGLQRANPVRCEHVTFLKMMATTVVTQGAV